VLKNKKCVLLIDCSATESVNAGKIKQIAESAITNIGKTWNDVITVSTDSASYMKKFFETVKRECNPQLVHINDIAHLVHVSVSYGFAIKEMKEIRDLILRFGNLFLNSNSLLNDFNSLLEENGKTHRKLKHVVDHRWFSYYETMVDIIDLWPFLCEFIDTHKSKKIDKIKAILNDDSNKVKFFLTIKGIETYLKPIYFSQKKCESNQANSQTIYKLVNESILSYLNCDMCRVKPDKRKRR
jgi:hypothetical protein